MERAKRVPSEALLAGDGLCAGRPSRGRRVSSLQSARRLHSALDMTHVGRFTMRNKIMIGAGFAAVAALATVGQAQSTSGQAPQTTSTQSQQSSSMQDSTAMQDTGAHSR